VARLAQAGRALYGVLLNDAAGVVDDLIVYRRDDGFRAVVNASTRAKVLRWFTDHAAAFPGAVIANLIRSLGEGRSRSRLHSLQ
jgi:aminomethyltransferase